MRDRMSRFDEAASGTDSKPRALRSKCAAGVAGRGLNPDIFESPVALYLAVRNAIKRHTSCETEIFESGFGSERSSKPEYHFFRDRLDRRRQIHVALCDRRFRGSGSPSE